MAKLLSDSNKNVSAEPLAFNMLAAALLALEEAGNIRFEIEKDADTEETQLMVMPTGKPVSFPEKSIESRLHIFAPATVYSIMYDWLGEESLQPWERAITMGNILLAIRKLAIVKTENNNEEVFFLSAKGKVAIDNNAAACERIIDLLQTCNSSRPDIWEQLEIEISAAMQSRTHIRRENADNFFEPDPWDKESDNDRKEVLSDFLKPDLMSRIGGYLVGLFCWVAWLSLVSISHQESSDSYVEYKTAGSIIVIFILLYTLKDLKLPPVVRLFTFLNDVLRTKRMKRIPLDGKSYIEKTVDRLAFIPFVGGLIHLLIYYVERHVFVLIVLIVAAFAGVYALLKMKARDAINKKVLGDPRDRKTESDLTQGTDNAGAANSLNDNNAIQQAATTWQNPVVLNIIQPEALPPVSEAATQRLAAIKERGPDYFKICKQLLFRMCTVFVILTLLYWLAFRTPLVYPWNKEAYFPTGLFFFLLFYGFTMMMLNRRISAWLSENLMIVFGMIIANAFLGINVTSVNATKISETKEHKSPLRPAILIVLLWCWFIVCIYITETKFTTIHHSFSRIIFCLISISILIYAYVWFKKQRNMLEQKYPYLPPVNLLALRVFGSPYLSDFLRLTQSWQWMGTTQRLDGPETAGEKGEDVINYITGKIDKSIVETPEELQQSFEKFKTKADKKLRFTLNSMQCIDATWKDALQNLLNKADVVVMDFSNLSEKNKGVAFELHKLFDQFAIKRLVFLVNDSTDMKVLEQICNKAWNERSADSPNGPETAATINCYHTGVMPAQQAKESYYDWKKRFEVNIDGDHLVGILYDCSQPTKNPVIAPDPKKDWHSIHWTSFSMSLKLQFLIKLVLGIYFFSQLYGVITSVFNKPN